MSLFLPSNLSPNFEEIVPNVSSGDGEYNGTVIEFTF